MNYIWLIYTVLDYVITILKVLLIALLVLAVIQLIHSKLEVRETIIK